MNEAAQELAGISTANISDALFRMGHKDRTMHARIKPVDEAMTLAGPACTAWAYPGGTWASSEALKAAEPGQVIVLDGKGYLEAVLWGEIFSYMATAKGVAGAVIDGAVRDIDGVREVGFPLFAAGITPAAGTGDKLGEVNVPIQCAGVVVNPGDWVFGDMLGVVVVRPDELETVLDWCRQIVEKEAKMIADAKAEIEARRDG
ncbi:MAG: RraA family protein [Armatimonadetes bacterium]|nr:RraA family protein [Armatimonadota bacterium]